MTEKIKPALTSEEWAGILADPHWWAYRSPQHGGQSTPVVTERHGLAAAALYGQPFGFTREDAELLTWLLRNARETETDIVIDDWLDQERTDRLRSLTERVKALLPPAK